MCACVDEGGGLYRLLQPPASWPPGWLEHGAASLRCADAAWAGSPPTTLQGQPLVPWCLPNTADRHNGWRGLFGRLDWNGHFPTSTTDPQPMGKVRCGGSGGILVGLLPLSRLVPRWPYAFTPPMPASPEGCGLACAGRPHLCVECMPKPRRRRARPVPQVGQVFHPEQDRIVSVRECARAQGFPDKHRFVGNVHNKHRQVGNAVPPPLAAALGRQLRAALEKKAEQDRAAALGM